MIKKKVFRARFGSILRLVALTARQKNMFSSVGIFNKPNRADPYPVEVGLCYWAWNFWGPKYFFYM